jgi:hypothetical protein
MVTGQTALIFFTELLYLQGSMEISISTVHLFFTVNIHAYNYESLILVSVIQVDVKKKYGIFFSYG